MLNTIYENLGVVIAYSVVILVVQNFLGEKASQLTVLITILSMLLFNSDKFASFADSFKTK